MAVEAGLYREMTGQPQPQSNLGFRDALSEWDHVASDLVFAGSDSTPPLITIAITTYRRPDFLLESVGSALAQDTDLPFEIVVIDNDPESNSLQYLLEQLPALRTRNFRYYVNARNIGMFGNINRSIPLARGEWLTILHDDDLLRSDYLRLMFAVLNRSPEVDGIVCQQRIMDQRAVPGGGATVLPRMTHSYIKALLLGGPRGWRTLARRLHGRVQFEATVHRFLGRTSRRIYPRTLFWGPVLGNGSGFLFRTRIAKEMGGFYSEEFPASDLYFYARFASRYHMRQHREEASVYRVAENESLKLETALGAFFWIHELQKALAGRYVPRWWLRLTPLIMARWLVTYREHWRVDIPPETIENLLKMRLPRDRKHVVFYLRLFMHGL